jgi:hypothetical protein
MTSKPLRPLPNRHNRAGKQLILAVAIAPVEVQSGWFVIVGSYPHDDPGTARKQAGRVIGRGFNAEIIDTDNYANLTDGYFSVVIGPYSRSRALQQLGLVKPLIGDAYIKEVY